MFIIRELIRDRARFGRQVLPGVGWVEWGARGENVIEVPDEIGKQLIKQGRYHIYREIKFPVPIESVKTVTPVQPAKPKTETAPKRSRKTKVK